MADILFLRRRLLALRPVDPMSSEILERIPSDEDVKAEITRPRNLKHHRKFFALLNAIYPHQDIYPTRAAFRAAMTVALGFGETVKLRDGRTIIVPHSISFAKMDQAEFEAFYDRAVELIVTRIVPGVGRADLAREVDDILAGYSDSQLRLPAPTRAKSPGKRMETAE